MSRRLHTLHLTEHGQVAAREPFIELEEVWPDAIVCATPVNRVFRVFSLETGESAVVLTRAEPGPAKSLAPGRSRA